MKKVFVLLMTLYLTFAATCVCAEESTTPVYDFKTFTWGASIEEVKTVEGEPLTSGKVNGLDAEYIVYETNAVGLDMILAYYFCDDGLFQVRYVLSEDHSNEDLYIDDYEKFRNALTKKYGKPLLDWVNWNDDSMKEYYQENGKSMGDAVCYGYCSYITWYSSDRTNITMSMSADNYEISMTVDYESKEIDPGEADYSGEI